MTGWKSRKVGSKTVYWNKEWTAVLDCEGTSLYEGIRPASEVIAELEAEQRDSAAYLAKLAK